MKRLALFVFLIGLVFASASPVSAARNDLGGTFALTGRITAIGDGAVTVQVLGGNKLVKPYINQPLTVTVTASTRFLLKEGTTVIPITFADLKVGDPVSVNGTVANQVWTAARITVGALLIHHP